MNIGFIGAGKAGTSLGVYFRRHNIPVTGYASRTMESSKEAARVTESAVFSNINELVTDSDIIFITTSDGVIEEIAKELANLNLERKMLCHVSGSVSSEVLKTASCKYGSAHPMMAINNRETDLSKAFFTIEGEDETADILQRLLTSCGNKTARIQSSKKKKYHCAASVASNLMVGLAAMAIDMLCDCGFEKEGAMALLEPLMTGNIASVCEKGPVAALTGPLERNDIQTVKAHMDNLEGRQKEIYRLLSLELVKLAREKHREQDYTTILSMLEEQKR